jgi:hypothetical protein
MESVLPAILGHAQPALGLGLQVVGDLFQSETATRPSPRTVRPCNGSHSPVSYQIGTLAA